MTLETLIVKTRNETFHEELLSEIVNLYPQLNWYVISTSSMRRAELRKKWGSGPIINPFHSLGDWDAGLIWVEDWPSLMGDIFEQQRFVIFSQCRILILGQRYEAPLWALNRLKQLSPDVTYILNENCPYLPLWPWTMRKVRLSDQIIWKPFDLYLDNDVDFQVGLDLKVHSYYMNTSLTHRLTTLNCKGLSPKEFLSVLKTLFLFFKNRLRLHWISLVDYHYENENRGNPHQKNSLSRSAYYWNIVTSQWKENIRLILWWSRWRKET
jgi:hypothetical protein